MMHVLMESGLRRRARTTRWTITSAMVHAAIITAAVAATSGVEASAFTPPVDRTIIYFAPSPPRASSLPASPTTGGQLIVVPTTPVVSLPNVPSPTIPTFDVTAPAARGVLSELSPAVGSVVPSSTTPTGNIGGVHTSGVVDRVVVALPQNPRPDYPQSLRSASLEGDVLITFVVDTTGRVEPGSLRIVQSSHPLFADAVQRWLPKTRYRPAEIGGRRVRQLVQQQVGFALANER